MESTVEKLRKKGLRLKLIATFLFLLLIIGLAGGSGLVFVARIQTNVGTLSDVVSPLRLGSSSLVNNMRESHITTLNILTLIESAEIARQVSRLDTLKAEFAKNLEKLSRLVEKNKIQMNIKHVQETQQSFFLQAYNALAAHRKELEKGIIVNQKLEEFFQQCATLDQSLENLVNTAQTRIAEKEDSSRTLIQSGNAKMNKMEQLLNKLFSNDFPVIDSGGKMRSYLVKMQEVSKSYLAEDNQENLAKLEKSFKKTTKKFNSRLKRIKNRLISEEDKSLYQTAVDQFTYLGNTAQGEGGLFALHRDYLKTVNEIKITREILLQTSDEFSQALNEIFTISATLDDQVKKTTKDSVGQSLLFIALIMIIGMITAIFGALYIIRTIILSLQKVMETADKIAEGDLDIHIESVNKDEIGQLMEAMQKMVDALRQKVLLAEQIAKGDLSAEVSMSSDRDELGKALQTMIEDLRLKVQLAEQIARGDLSNEVPLSSDEDTLGRALTEMTNKLNQLLTQVVANTEAIKATSEGIAKSSQNLSQGSSEQAASLEEISSSMEEMEGQARSNSDNAKFANQKSVEVKESAQKGNDHMQSMLKAMNEISETSEEVSAIIKAIDEIAFQTNVLAINAAVEAARAGEFGKGFAVVAEEVRNLAQRSAAASKETTSLILNSIKKIESGVTTANHAAKSLEQIVDGTSSAAELINSIVIGSHEQTLGIGQINQGLNQLNSVVQTNVAIAEKSADISQEMDKRADILQSLTSYFQLHRQPFDNRLDYSPTYEVPMKQLIE